ncbi:hypothetical protein M430DRAFT_208235 [Amorphotheca resinae ATCC 22711]|uniref:Extracellular membrane protein CFEM domain-containing protein n=1 Tax=Amorphotheca resinae ATCC 22711 TaxID=857342 RepID=A0A2T3BCD3_AMORE|nr:hypothetical protein M430DRAFT_208235 [Amorphotheca resinae ATCC 22711]PSS25914.1 hypothetical protein M430DRAFT_208235 [Amorphotheca resinae ATCC 22711]
MYSPPSLIFFLLLSFILTRALAIPTPARQDPNNDGLLSLLSPFSIQCAISWSESECYMRFSEECELWGRLPWEVSCREEGCACVRD